jgi:hypothetical protein
LRWRAFLNRRRLPLRSLAGGAGRSKARPGGDSRHLGERVEGLAFRQNRSLASANVSLRVGFRFVRQRRTRSVEHHAFGPFMIRMDPDVDLIERNVRTWRTCNRRGATLVRGKQRCEQKASHPSEILKQRHGYTPSAPICRLQLTATGFAEIAQWVHLVDQIGQVDECPVRGQIGIEDQPARLLGRFNHGIAGENLHTCD